MKLKDINCRILAFVLSLAMLIGTLPVYAVEAETDLSDSNESIQEIKDENGGGSEQAAETAESSGSEEVSGYRTTKQDSDVILLTVSSNAGSDTSAEYYFGDAKDAFEALKDENLSDSSVKMTVLKDAKYQYTTNSTTDSMKITQKQFTLDLNGKTLELETSKPGHFCLDFSGESMVIEDDSSGKNGVLSFSGKNGIKVSGTNSTILIESGTLTDSNPATAGALIQLAGNKDGNYAKATISGGTLEGRLVTNTIACRDVPDNFPIFEVNGGTIQTKGNTPNVFSVSDGSLKITGGEIISDKEVTDDMPVISIGSKIVSDRTDPIFEMTGGKVTSYTKHVPVTIKSPKQGKVKIGGTAEILGTKSSGIRIDADMNSITANESEIEIQDDAKIKGSEYAVSFNDSYDDISAGNGYNLEDMSERLSSVKINGGYFACGDEYIPIMDTSLVTFKEDHVLNTKPETGNNEGYYTLTTKESLSGTNKETNETYSYQDFDGKIEGGYGGGLNQILKDAKELVDAGNDDTKYPDETWKAFMEAYNAAVALKKNENANQMEIDLRARNLSAALNALTSSTAYNLDALADGKYSVEASFYKTTMAGPSMAAGAVNGAATLIVDHNSKSNENPLGMKLELHFKPTFTSGLWGHLLQLWLYNGSNPGEAKANSNTGDVTTKAVEATYKDFYAHDESNNTVTKNPDAEKDSATTGYPYPGTVTINMPYVGNSSDYSTLYCKVGVDAMRGLNGGTGKDANVLVIMKWSTLKELDVKPTLTVDTDEVSLIAPGSSSSGSGANSTKTFTATLRGANNYKLSASSDNTSIATVDSADADGKFTIEAKSAGDTTITVTGTKNGSEPLTQTIKVHVASADKKALSVGSGTVDENTSKKTLDGDVFVNSDGSDSGGVEAESSKSVSVDATVKQNSGQKDESITKSEVSITERAAKALEEKNVTIQTNVGDVTLDSALMGKVAEAAETNTPVTLSIEKAETPSGLTGSYTDYYELELTVGGAKVEFGDGEATVSVPCDNEQVKYAYWIENNKRKQGKPVTVAEDRASWTTDHFSFWALSETEYADAVGNGTDKNENGKTPGAQEDESFFLSKDGRYYVDIDLWKSDSNEASMGNVAFKNNDRALVTVSNGKVTDVEITTNPVDVSQYHSAIITFELADGTNVSVLETGKVTTKPANKEYDYIKRVKFKLPDSAQPTDAYEVTYVPVNFYVPDTPMDAAVGETLTARIRFDWSTVSATNAEALVADDSTAKGTSSITGEEIEDVVLSDSATGIKLETDTERLDSDAEMKVETLTSGSDFDKAKKAMEGVQGEWKLYKIDTLVDGKSVAPDGSVTLSFPCGGKSLTVYRISDAGKKIEIKGGTVKNGYYVITTSSLGLFAVVEGEAEEASGVVLKDETTGIKLEADSAAFDGKEAVMTVNALTSGAEFEKAQTAMAGIDGEWSLYKIDALVDGKTVAPGSPVTISFPCGGKELTIYRIDENGGNGVRTVALSTASTAALSNAGNGSYVRTRMNGTVENGYYVVTTDRLGLFAVMGDISDEIPADSAEGQDGENQADGTGEGLDPFNGLTDENGMSISAAGSDIGGFGDSGANLAALMYADDGAGGQNGQNGQNAQNGTGTFADNSPQTGDDSSTGMWALISLISILLIAAVAAAAGILTRRKK